MIQKLKSLLSAGYFSFFEPLMKASFQRDSQKKKPFCFRRKAF